MASPLTRLCSKLPEDENAKIDPLTLPFTPIGTDQMSPDRWIGQRQEIYLTATEAGTARLAEQDVVITNPLDNQVDVAGLAGDCLQGTGAAAVTQVATSKSSVTQGGAMGFTVNTAEGNATTDVTMMDMNGDGYPDIVAGGVVQYTNSQGGISGKKSQKLEKISSENSSSSKGYGGNPVASVSSIVKLIKHSPQDSMPIPRPSGKPSSASPEAVIQQG